MQIPCQWGFRLSFSGTQANDALPDQLKFAYQHKPMRTHIINGSFECLLRATRIETELGRVQNSCTLLLTAIYSLPLADQQPDTFVNVFRHQRNHTETCFQSSNATQPSFGRWISIVPVAEFFSLDCKQFSCETNFIINIKSANYMAHYAPATVAISPAVKCKL